LYVFADPILVHDCFLVRSEAGLDFRVYKSLVRLAGLKDLFRCVRIPEGVSRISDFGLILPVQADACPVQ
jgi:hypothetical protein